MASAARWFPASTLRHRAAAACVLAFAVAACESPTDGDDPNQPPLAVAAVDALACTGTAVELDGTASSDPDGDPRTFAWSVVSAPPGSGATITAATSAVAEIVPDLGGEYLVELRVSDGVAEGADTATIEATSTEISDDITADTTFTAVCPVYQVPGSLVVRAAMVIEPGVTLRFGAGLNVRLIIDDDGSLRAVGTAEDTIRFVSEQTDPGAWEGIEFRSPDAANQLTYVEVAHGGRGSHDNIAINGGAEARITNSLIRDSGQHGIHVGNGGVLAEFSGNTFRDNVAAPVNLRADQMGSLDGASSYAGGNGSDRIEVRGGEVVDPQTWPATDAPWFVMGIIGVEAAVVVEPGATLVFEEGLNRRLIVEAAGSLSALGTAQDTIRFISEPATAGAWEGIEVRSDSPDNRLDFVEIAYGGRSGYHNVEVSGGAAITVTNSLIRDSAAWGIYVENTGQLTASDNTFANNADGDVRLP